MTRAGGTLVGGSGDGSTPRILVTGVPHATWPFTSHFSWGLTFCMCY